MGSSISGFEHLLKMPYGCGEQNMINFAPSMFVRSYLETVDQLTQSIKEKSIKIMRSGKHVTNFNPQMSECKFTLGHIVRKSP